MFHDFSWNAVVFNAEGIALGIQTEVSGLAFHSCLPELSMPVERDFTCF